MTDTTCSNYLSKINDIQIACNANDTTKNDIETLLTDLTNINDTFNDDVLTMNLPVTVAHFDMFILCRVEMESKIKIHSSLINLINIRNNEVNNMSGQDYEAIINPYITETKNIKTYVDSVINNCNCMSKRCNITNFLIKCSR